MPEHDLEKLVGGFAADTLTPDERAALFRAALQDQELFTAMADEQALKELLADPAVRRKLLQALAPRQDVGRWRSWLNRFTSPAGLAWTGGVAVGVFAVVLGVRVYEEGLRHGSETVVLEEGRVQAPLKEAEQEEKAAPRPEPGTKDILSKRRDQAAGVRPKDTPVPGIERDKQRRPLRQDQSTDTKPPVAALGQSSEQPASPGPRAAPASPPAVEPELDILRQADHEDTTAGSARTLFYGQASSSETAATPQDTESAQKTDRLALARKAPQRAAPIKPLALRYSFMGDEAELQAEGAADRSRTLTLTVESNQEAYVQIWKRAGDSLPELVLPAKETGRISLKTAAGERRRLTVPAESDRLIVRLSRVPFGPITRQEAVMAGRGSPAQLMESVTGPKDPATYVANPDLSATELAAEIPIERSAQ